MRCCTGPFYCRENDMNLVYLEYFLKVAEKQHMTQVADELHITQPALSRAISRLEEEVGTELFDREGKGIRLNENGMVVKESAEKIFEELSEMQQKLDDMKKGVSGSISIGSSFPNREPDLIQDCVLEFMQKYPNVSINYIQQSSRQLVQALEDKQIDLAITGYHGKSQDIEWKELFREKLGVILSKKNPLSEKDELSLSDLSGERFYCNNANSDLEDLTRDFCRKAGFEPNIFFQGFFPELIGYSVSANKGVSLIAEGHFEPVQTNDWRSDICYRDLKEKYCMRVCGIAVNKKAYHSKAMQLFEKYMVEFIYLHREKYQLR